MFLIHSGPEQAPLLVAAVAAACRLPQGWSSPLQPQLLQLLVERLLGVSVDLEQLPAVQPALVREALQDPAQRRELVDLMVLLEMVCRPIPEPLQASVDRWAAALEVDDRALL
ncbi:MAG: hypothetical protein RLZZ533_884, partial [Cyanobacteriota bacterium]